MAFVIEDDTRPESQKHKKRFVVEGEEEPEIPRAQTRSGALKTTLGYLGKTFGVDPGTYKRAGEIMGEEFVGGAKDVIEAFGDVTKRRKEKPSMIIPGFGRIDKETLLGTGKAAMGAMRSLWSPVTATTRARYGEPTEEIAEKMGLPGPVPKIAGVAAEIAPQLAIPGGIVKKMLGKAPKVVKGAKVIKETVETAKVPSHVKKLWNALKEAPALRKAQEKLYSEELGKRVGGVIGIGEKTKLVGRQKLYAQLGQLKGELPKFKERSFFESIAKKINEDDVVKLLDDIDASKYLTPLEKISAKVGLSEEILSPTVGVVPTRNTIRLLSEVFPEGFVKTLLDKRTTFQKIKDIGLEVINVPRTIMASTDLSAAFRQGIFAGPRHPILFAKSFGRQFKHAFSQKSYNKVIKQIKDSENYLLAKKHGLSFTELGGIGGEEAYMGAQIAERIPVVGRVIKGSNRAYTGFLNKFRIDLFNDFLRRNPGIVKDAKGMKQLTAYINAATGRGNLKGAFKKAGPLLNGVFFSPRLMMSRIKLLNPLYYVNPKLNPAVRREALTSLISYVSTGMTMLGLAKMAGADVGLDPRSANFGKIIKGNTRFDIWGGFQQYARLIGQLISGKMVSSTTGREYNLGEGYKPTTPLDIIYRFGESKENPVLSFVTGVIRGQNFIGDEFNIPEEVLNRVVPVMSSMVVQDLYDIYKEGGLKDVPWATPAIFGVGIQTYGRKIPKLGLTPSGKPKMRIENIPGLSEDVLSLITGKPATTIPEELHEGIIKREERKSQRRYEMQKWKSERKKEKVKRRKELLGL